MNEILKVGTHPPLQTSRLGQPAIRPERGKTSIKLRLDVVQHTRALALGQHVVRGGDEDELVDGA